jgi:DNA-binding CsgD family transcriptional regulator
MVLPAALNECLLDLALQRNLPGFQQALKRTLDLFGLSAWAVVLPPTSALDGRPVFMAQGIKSEQSPLLTLATKQGLDAVFPPQGAPARIITTLAREMSPESTSRCRVLRSRRDKGGEFILFCYRPPHADDFSADQVELLTRVANLLDRCFMALAEDQENQFEAGLFRLVGNLHPEGLCVLDNRLRVLFENRRFKEQMHVWNHGLTALQNLTLPKQSELPAVWKEACDRSFQAFREVKLPAVTGRMVVTQGSLSALKQPVDAERWIEGAVRYLAFQSALGVRPYLVLTSALHRKQTTINEVTLARVSEQLGFSRRETELAELILRGSSAREIAGQLKIALPTVKTHIRHILHKAGAKTRLQFVGLCRPQG